VSYALPYLLKILLPYYHITIIFFVNNFELKNWTFSPQSMQRFKVIKKEILCVLFGEI